MSILSYLVLFLLFPLFGCAQNTIDKNNVASATEITKQTVNKENNKRSNNCKRMKMIKKRNYLILNQIMIRHNKVKQRRKTGNDGKCVGITGRSR